MDDENGGCKMDDVKWRMDMEEVGVRMSGDGIA